jgi:hypothetical protein
MFCPQCGTETHEALKYCKQCGTNLRRVQGVMGKGGAGYMLSNEARFWHEDWLQERREQRERERKKTPEEKRFNEIKGGVITSCVGLGVMIFLYFLFGAITDQSSLPGQAVNILRTLHLVGIIPFLIGLGIIFNGLFLSKRIVQLKREEEQPGKQPLFSPNTMAPDTAPVPRLPAQSPVSDFSVTETTTTELREPSPVSSPRKKT